MPPPLIRVFTLAALAAVFLNAQADKTPLTVGYADFHPLLYRSSDGKPEGFVVEVLEAAAAREGTALKWEFLSGSPDAALAAKTIDLWPAGATTRERQACCFVSRAWWAKDLNLLARAGSGFSRDSLRGRRVALTRIPTLQEMAARHLGDTVLIPLPSLDEAMTAVCEGTAEAALVDHIDVMRKLLDRPKACGGIALELVPTFGIAVDLSIIAQPDVSRAAARLRDRIDELSADGTMERIASAHPQISAHVARYLTKAARATSDRALLQYGFGFAAFLCLAGGALLLKSRANVARRRRMNAELRQSELRLERAQRMASLGAWEMDLRTGRGYWSDEVYRVFGLDKEQFRPTRDTFYQQVHPEDRQRVRAAAQETIATGHPYSIEHRIVRPDGTERYVREHGALDRGSLVGTVQDVTAYRQLEDQFRQAQKLESVGRLAGGIAHDFNNLLTVINGYAELALGKTGAADPMRASLLEIRKAGLAAAGLTRQLLLFSRKDIVRPIVLDLNALILDSGKMLRRIIGEDIELVTVLEPELGCTLIDPGCMQQVLMNLVVNARDAMAGGGKLIIETAKATLEAAEFPQVPPGPYIALIVRDTGSGMDAATKGRVFEPFFTTKPSGRGTGLGLATVYGIVQQAGGAIAVESSPGQGSTFSLYFPRTDSAASVQAMDDRPAYAGRGGESILVVEDQLEVLSLTLTILKGHGYRTRGAATAAEALEMCSVPACVDVIITDIVLPGMSGRELAERLRVLCPSARVIFTSGYSDEMLSERGLLSSGEDYLQKPVPAPVLLKKVRSVLASRTDTGIPG